MGPLIVALLPYMVGSALFPAQIIIGSLLLKNPRQGLLKGLAYVSGMTTMRLLQGLIFGLLLTKSAGASSQERGEQGPIVSALLLMLAILLLITAYKQWSKEDDPDGPPPRWLAMIDTLTPLKAFGVGFGLIFIGAKFWVFTLSALGTIAEARLGQPSSTVAFLLYILMAQILILLPLFVRIIMPEHSKKLLEEVSAWLTRYSHLIVMIVSLVFGLLFLYQGVSGLLH